MSNLNLDTSNAALLTPANIMKNVLPHYGLQGCKSVSQVKFKDTDKQRAVYRVETSQGDYCLKKVYYPVDELLFIYSVIEWLYRNNINVPRILSTENHGRYVNYNDMLFILTPWINGDKCDFDDLDHLNMTSRNLGLLHQVSEGFMPILGSKNKEGFNNLTDSLNKHRQQLLATEDLAIKYNDYFSKVFLANLPSAMTLANISASVGNTINSDNLTKSICHNDYVSKNLIVKDSNLYVIDFDKCRYDYSAFDISYCLRRLLRRDSTSWNTDLAINYMQQYEAYNTLTLDDYKYILAYLAYPQKFWKLSRDYYNNIQRCNKKSFIGLMNKAISSDKKQIEFSQKFARYIEKKFYTKLSLSE